VLHEAATRALLTARRMRHPPWPSDLHGHSRRRCPQASPRAFGCVGNRIYTGISDDEFYSVIAGKDLARGGRTD
jgi:hypothetical protein